MLKVRATSKGECGSSAKGCMWKSPQIAVRGAPCNGGFVAPAESICLLHQKSLEPASNSTQQIRNYTLAIIAEDTLQRPLRNHIALVYVLHAVFEKTAIDWFSHR